MKAVIRISLGLLVGILLFGIARNLLADGFRLPDQDAFATARGEAFAATADNASAIYYNPARISQLKDWDFQAGVYGIYLPLTYQQPNTSRTFENNKKLQAAPQVFGTFGLNGYPITFGLGGVRSLSAGYIYSQSAVPDAHYSRLVGDEARHWLSVGTEHKCGRYSFAVAYQIWNCS